MTPLLSWGLELESRPGWEWARETQRSGPRAEGGFLKADPQAKISSELLEEVEGSFLEEVGFQNAFKPKNGKCTTHVPPLSKRLPLADITDRSQLKPEITSSDDFSTKHSKDH